MIEVTKFVSAMNQHWTNNLNNVSSAALQQAWAQIGDAFNNHIAAHDDPTRSMKLTVLSPPTGSGKSQGTAVYCSLLSQLVDAPGVLIVTRLKTDADSMADAINTLSKKQMAKAFHSDSKDVPITELWNWDVLVITHRAYELALDRLGSHGQIQQTWPLFHRHGIEGVRKLVVIDESLDIVEESQGNLDGLRQTIGCIPQELRDKHVYAVMGIQAVISIIEQMTSSAEGKPTKEAILLREAIKGGNPPDFTELRRDLRSVRFDMQLHRNDLTENTRLAQIHDRRLKQLDVIFRSWSYYAKLADKGHTLNTARLLVPEGTKGAVVLDATAMHDVIYELFDKVDLVDPPQGVRDYSNVNLWVSRGHKQGKIHMRNNAKSLCDALMSELAQRVSSDSNVFVCCHKEVEPTLKAYSPKFNLNVGHWGAVDGSNNWQDCDTAVIFGLPYIPDTWAANTYFALQGVQDDEWLNSKDRPHGKHLDVREALKTGHIVSSVVQAINRIRCRKVIDDLGNCPKADVYLMLPNGKAGESMLEGILESMPSVNLIDWTFSESKVKIRKSNCEEALVSYAQLMPVGRVPSSIIKHDIGISVSSWERLVGKLKDSSSELMQRLSEVGTRYVVEGQGRGQRAYLLKAKSV